MTGADLKSIRERLGVTQEEMGRLLMRHKNMIARYEREDRVIPPIVAKLAELLSKPRSQKKSSETP